MSIHFVYAASPGVNTIEKISKRFIYSLQNKGFPISYVYPRDNPNLSKWPERAPFSITYNVFQALKQIDDVLLYDWKERGVIKGGKSDILIGHPSLMDGADRIWDRSCRESDFGLKIAMLPLSHRMIEYCWGLEPFVPLVDGIFGIMGQYWYETWNNSAIAHWKKKITPIDMAIDIKNFARVKKSFNPPGNRKFVYIGWSGAQKGTHLLSILFGLAKEHRCIAIGRGPAVPNIEQRSPMTFNEEYIRKLAEECDFFITMGVSDANPTTILEAMAWGFPVCCTPQSGYYNMPEINQMSIDDMEHNLSVLNRLQYAPEEELLAQSDKARFLASEKYTWKRFTKKIIDEVQILAKTKKIG